MESINFNVPPPKTEYCLLTFPLSRVLIVTINLPKKLNALTFPAHFELDEVFNWYNKEPELWVAIITGAGNKAFCVGQDLGSELASNEKDEDVITLKNFPTSGFAGLSRRVDCLKPIIAAVNGFAIGGGMEIVLACDIVVAAENSIFSLPEVKRGLAAVNGGLTRLVRFIGYQRACELTFTGQNISAKRCKELGLVNIIVPTYKDVIPATLEIASKIIENSPDAIKYSKQGILYSLESPSLTEAERKHFTSDIGKKFYSQDNFKEGILSFKEKRKPKWKNSKL
ncbi:ClpP/crotonase-like domain-containing protein [Glomus cerebriforme]|uniref:ClpP/crotonase-like domain-containing protein n=1 Tax=Glomus cerebriforme TaxID=658196 RepID=A0A397TAX9_9GLOM|nr:ClpP/crotonase-like domain-containing protein [Glomus cerebriforme]